MVVIFPMEIQETILTEKLIHTKEERKKQKKSGNQKKKKGKVEGKNKTKEKI